MEIYVASNKDSVIVIGSLESVLDALFAGRADSWCSFEAWEHANKPQVKYEGDYNFMEI